MLDTWCGVVVLVKYNIEEKQLSDVIVIQLGFRDSALLYAIGMHIALMGFQKSRLIKNRISVNSFRGIYSFLNLTLCTVTLVTVHTLYRCGNYSREETICGNTVYVFLLHKLAKVSRT